MTLQAWQSRLCRVDRRLQGTMCRSHCNHSTWRCSHYSKFTSLTAHCRTCSSARLCRKLLRAPWVGVGGVSSVTWRCEGLQEGSKACGHWPVKAARHLHKNPTFLPQGVKNVGKLSVLLRQQTESHRRVSSVILFRFFNVTCLSSSHVRWRQLILLVLLTIRMYAVGS